MTTKLYCSFCGKEQSEVKNLIAGPTVFICNECVSLCVGVCLGTTKTYISVTERGNLQLERLEKERSASAWFEDLSKGIQRLIEQTASSKVMRMIVGDTEMTVTDKYTDFKTSRTARISLELEIKENGTLTIKSRDHAAEETIEMSGTQLSDFADLGPRLIQRLLTRKRITFEDTLRENWQSTPERTDEPPTGEVNEDH